MKEGSLFGEVKEEIPQIRVHYHSLKPPLCVCMCAGEPGPRCSMWRYSESQDPLRPSTPLQEEHHWNHPTFPRE